MIQPPSDELHNHMVEPKLRRRLGTEPGALARGRTNMSLRCPLSEVYTRTHIEG